MADTSLRCRHGSERSVCERYGPCAVAAMGQRPQTDGGVPAPGGNRAPATEATATATPPSPTLNVDEVAALLLPYISHVHDGWARQEAIKAAREVVALARAENDVKAEALYEVANDAVARDIWAIHVERIREHARALRSGGA